MELMQRFGSKITDSYVDDYVKAILKYPGSCDVVWLASEYGYPPIERHKQYAEKLGAVAQKIRKNNIKVSLQISNTIGHGEYMSSKDCSGLVYDGSPAERMVGHNGVVSNYCFCWRGKHFRKYLLESTKYYIEHIKPDCVWVDDDFRARHHRPVDFGCFCDNCISEFNKRYEADFSRQELVEEILHGDIIWRERYIEFIREGMYKLMYDMGKVIHEISPETTMGLQHGFFGAYTGFGMDFVYDAMKAATGHDVKSRPGGGAYSAHNPNEIIEKGVILNWQNAQLNESVRNKCPEIENLPFCAFGKDPSTTAFESSYYFANGNTDMTYSMIMRVNEPMEWHEAEFEIFAKHRPYWERMSEINFNSYQGGMRLYVSENIWKKQLGKDEDFFTFNDEKVNVVNMWLRDGFPVAYDRKEEAVFILHPECVDSLTDDEIQFLLSKNVLTDGESIAKLSKRGINFGLEAKEISAANSSKLTEKATNSDINGSLEGWTVSGFVAGKNEKYYFENVNADMEVLAFYQPFLSLEKFSDDENYPYGIADMIITTPLNAKWAVFGYAPWKGVISFAKREQILNAVDSITNFGLCARILTPKQAVILPRKDKDGKTVCVSVTNCTIGESGELEVLIRNPKSCRFTYMSQYNGSGELKCEKTDDGYIVKLPSINAWSVATIFCDR